MRRRGRARGRFPLRDAAFQPTMGRRQPPAQPLAQTAAVGLASATDAALTVVPLVSAGTDTFEARANGTLGAPWAAFSTFALPVVSSGEVFANADLTADAAAYPAAIGPGMFSEIVLAAAPTVNTNMGFEVHARISGSDFYTFRWDSAGGNRARLLKTISGTPTVMTSVASPATLNTVTGLRITAIGSALKGYLRISGVWTQVTATTDSAITAAGYAGFATQLAAAGANPIGVEQVSWGAATAGVQTIAVGQAAETELAQTQTRVKAKALGQTSETDTAQSAAHQKTRAAGLATETEAAQTVAVRRVKTIAVGLVTEVQTAQPITRTLPSGPAASKVTPGSRGRDRGRFPLRGKPWSAPQRGRGLGTWAQGPRTAQVITVGQVVETQLALSLVNAAQTITVGIAAETETAQRVLAARLVSAGFPYPIWHYIAGPFIVAAAASETETAQPIARVKTKALGRPSDTELAISVAAIGAKVVNVGIAAETDTATPVARTRPIGQAPETETALAQTHRKTRAVGQSGETDTAQAVRPAHSRVLGLIVDTQTALAVTRVKTKAAGEPLEFSTAFSHRHTKRKAIGQALEQDAALASNAKLIAVGLATETETPRAVLASKVKATGQATTADAAQAIRAARVYPVGLVISAQTAQAVRAVKVVSVTQAAETDTSIGFVGQGKRISLGLASEAGSALSLLYAAPRVFTVGRPVTRERALPLVTRTSPFTYEPVPGGYVETGGAGHVEPGGVLVA